MKVLKTTNPTLVLLLYLLSHPSPRYSQLLTCAEGSWEDGGHFHPPRLQLVPQCVHEKVQCRLGGTIGR